MKQARAFSLIMVLLFFGVIAASLSPFNASAQTCEQWFAKATSVQGTVEVKRGGTTHWEKVMLNDTFCLGDIVRIRERSRADIVMKNEANLRLDQNTSITFSEIEKERIPLINLLSGAAHFFSRIPRSLRITTPFFNGAVEGTEFFIDVQTDQALLSVFNGTVIATNAAGSITLNEGQSAVVPRGGAPVSRIVVRPRDAVQWALYYPPVIYYPLCNLQPPSQEEWQKTVRRSCESYREGDLERAISTIVAVTEAVPDPRFYTYRASLLLSVGRVDEATSDIEKSLQIAEGNSSALSLQSIIALTQDEKEKALNLAHRALQNDLASVPARIALSYALQANFDLEGALANVKEAVRLEADNALVLARLAELTLSFGRLDEALKVAQEAAALNPNLARTQTVLGFAYLMQINTGSSISAFHKAIELDQADPLPRLGLGLAKIREGDLTGGRGEIEIAASLDQDNSLIRSYLGKAYYEEKRDTRASDQFSVAEALDPSDPTPLFYDAIQKQSQNRPVEALHELEQSIELNDNRAIYRSRLLLDEDLAARSASLARIYSDLGFQWLALVEGWKSVDVDPSNYSAHMFLADSYSSLPRHEIARVSELLQAQLLQPMNITPVQPHLEDRNFFALNGAGPANVSFNEFNPLFNRNQLGLQATGVAGGDSTFSDELVQYGIWNKLSYSIGQFHYETNGFRQNNDLNQDIYNVFAQVSLSPATSIQAEVRSTIIKNGDLSLNFFPGDYLPNERNKEDDNSIRLGLHHNLAPGSDIIASVLYQHGSSVLYDSEPFAVVNLNQDEDSYSVELQHIYRSEKFNLISGAGFFDVDQNNLTSTEFLFPFPVQSVDESHADILHTNLYLYSQINLLKSITLTVGGSADIIQGGIVNRDQFNPKLGVVWNPLPATTVRAAVFRVLKRTLITNQTLEPTQVAGFNQFFDDADGTDAWCYGAAIDQRFSVDLYGGIEFYQRDLTVPFEDFSTPVPAVNRVDWTERLGRGYLYWTPHKWLALSAAYQYEQFDRDPQFVAGIEHVETHRVPLGINFYHPSGLSAALRVTYINQRGVFQPQQSASFLPGSDQFWLADAALGYRLPKRLGLISVEGKNLFNKSFSYQDTDPVNPLIQPKRVVFAKITLAL